MEQSAGGIVLLQACGTSHIKMILESGSLHEDGRRADGFEAVVERGRKCAHDETKFVLGANIFRGGAKDTRTAPHHKRCQHGCEAKAGRDGDTNGEQKLPLHNSFGRDREL